jgi:hypothetical protein
MTFKNNFIYLSPEAFQEYQDLQEIIQRIQVGENETDSWQYIWGSGTYTSKKYYNLPFKNINSHLHSYGTGTQDAATSLELSPGFC